MKKLISLMAMCFLLTINAQEKDKKWHYGFEIGGNYSNVIGRNKTNGLGFELGISTKRRIAENLFFNPIISFGYSSATYNSNPILDYYLNFQPKISYFISEHNNSVFFSFAPAFQRRLEPAQNAKDYINNHNFSWNLGVGMIHHLKSFDLQTELRYSFGLTEKLNSPAVQDGPGFKSELPIYFHSIGIYFQFL